MNSNVFIIGIFIFCLALSFLMSGMEAGVLSLSRIRIRQLRRTGNRRAEILHGYLEQPEHFLWTIVVGNSIANFTLLAIIALTLHSAFHGRAVVSLLVFLGAVFLLYTLCELLPKTLFRLHPNRFSLIAVTPFRLVSVVLWPLVAFISWFSRGLLKMEGVKQISGTVFGNRDELRFTFQESMQDLTSEERGMIARVLDLQNASVGQVTIAFPQVASISAQAPMKEVLALAREKRHTRFPVWQNEGARQRIVGIISLKRLLYSNDLNLEKNAGDYLKPALFVEENVRLEEALRRLQRSGQRMAIVLGRDRREIGIVTLQDILQRVFGEMSL